ncbi:MAG TPA: hypothetical protein PLA12_11475 [Candidatus Hydrogenedens sp.]|nr:hypothetical protein [Candidatus Hydrogenedens sp.]
MNVLNTNIINNPLTFYRLDPGEPGVAPPTPASLSAFTVFSQEARNRQRLKAEALMEGKEVVFLNTEYKLRKNGSFLTMVGGTTTIVTREKTNEEKKKILDLANGEQKINTNINTDKIDNALKIKENLLKAERRMLKIKLKNVEGEEKRIIETRLKEIEYELKKIEKLKQEQKQNDKEEADNPLNDNAVQGLLNSLDNPAGLIIDLMV